MLECFVNLDDPYYENTTVVHDMYVCINIQVLHAHTHTHTHTYTDVRTICIHAQLKSHNLASIVIM